MSSIPVRREKITIDWMTDMLSGTGRCEIAGLDLEEMTGHNPDLSQLFRARITYSREMSEHPDVVIVKIPPADDEIRLREAAYGPYAGELGSYRLLESYYGGPIARMYAAVKDRAEQTVCFVFEDLGVLPAGQKYAKVDLDIARSTLEFMAEYHAQFWRDDRLGQADWIRDADWALLFNQDPMESITGWQVIRDDNRFENTAGLVAASEYLGVRLNDLRDAMRSRPNTLTHNDFHQGNVLLRQTADGPMPVIIDWQLPAFSGATNDLVKFLMTAVPFDILSEHERQLVEHYADHLKANGVTGYSLDECWRDYRRAQVMVFANYAINCYKRTPGGSLIESSGDSTHGVIRALGLVDPVELAKILP